MALTRALEYLYISYSDAGEQAGHSPVAVLDRVNDEEVEDAQRFNRTRTPLKPEPLAVVEAMFYSRVVPISGERGEEHGRGL